MYNLGKTDDGAHVTHALLQKKPMPLTIFAQLYVDKSMMTYYGTGAISDPVMKSLLTSSEQALLQLNTATGNLKAELKLSFSGVAEARIDALVNVQTKFR